MRILPDGTMLVIRPDGTIPEGYEATKNPKVFVLKMPDCVYRATETVIKSCCGKVSILYCKLYSQRTTRQKCIKCGGKI